ncbi:hypothetical protein ABKJ49_003430 [Salmonella enterica subsp. enterica serovar Bareilly]|nr:hypothetical protein [Salmonella enterica]EGF6448594.1 hypothetical protein [Salmonella enterica subsp. enterica]EIW3690641.1 hypothetical protein [Salmonella enterica]EJD7639793.1 hypothetical protein [Salmonella enterica]
MSDEPGRGKFVDQAAEARPSVWRRTACWLRLDRMLFAEYGVSLDIENYCTVSLFFEQAYLSQ